MDNIHVKHTVVVWRQFYNVCQNMLLHAFDASVESNLISLIEHWMCTYYKEKYALHCNYNWRLLHKLPGVSCVANTNIFTGNFWVSHDSRWRKPTLPCYLCFQSFHYFNDSRMEVWRTQFFQFSHDFLKVRVKLMQWNSPQQFPKINENQAWLKRKKFTMILHSLHVK